LYDARGDGTLVKDGTTLLNNDVAFCMVEGGLSDDAMAEAVWPAKSAQFD
jgi:hypothetical protein